MNAELDKQDTTVFAKWGADISAGGYGSGWTAIPSALIRNIGELGLNGTDFAVLAVVLSYWWHADRLPSPKVGGIAHKLGVSTRTVERSLSKMTKLGLIDRSKTRHGGAFDLSPLVDKVTSLAVHDLEFLSEERRQRYEALHKEVLGEFDDISEEFDDDVPH